MTRDTEGGGTFELPPELIKKLNGWSEAVAQANAEIRKLTEPMRHASSELIASFEDSFSSLLESLKPLIENGRIARVLEGAGWLPHDLIPIELVQDSTPANELSLALEQHFARNWASTEEQLRTRFRSCNIDAESLAAMDEALFAHRYGRYRAACRTVFPEIERIARQRFYGTTHSRRITNLKEVKEAIGEVPITELRPHGYWGFRLWIFLNTVCYADIDPSEPFNPCVEPSLPNRHAILHGLRSSSTMRDSLNVFFIADFIFHLLDILARPKSLPAA